MNFLLNLWDLFIDMSFYISIGLFFTGLLHVFVKKEFILKHVGKNNTSAVVKAAIVGVPLPLCSCGVIPTALYLGKNGASKGSVMSFLTSTPQTGVDSLIATYGLMGLFYAVYRAVAAFISGIITGIVTNFVFRKQESTGVAQAKSSCDSGCCNEQELVSDACCGSCGSDEVNVDECCGSGKETSCSCSDSTQAPTCSCSDSTQAPSCGCSDSTQAPTCSCSDSTQAPTCGCGESTQAPSCGCGSQVSGNCFFSKIKRVFTYGFGEFLDEIAVHFVIGLIVAALISTFVPQSWLSSFSNPLLSMLVMLIIGIPMYICSTASIPIALSLIMKGISPGAAFVFLFAGPVTNIASLAILVKELGKKAVAVYLICVAVCAVAFGLLMDYIIEVFNVGGLNLVSDHAHSHQDPLYMVVVGIIFLGLVIRSLVMTFINKAHKKKSCSCS